MNGAPDLPLRVDAPPFGRVLCDRALRVLAGRRWTLAGTLEQGGQPVVAKLFLGRGARRHFTRERRGLEALRARGLAASELLYAGPSAQPPGELIVTAWLPGRPASTLGEAALPAVLKAVAQHHARGIEQRDAHLANFLVHDGVAWTLDGAGIHGHRGPLPARRALRNLAQWLAQFPPGIDARLAEWCALYATQAAVDPDALRRQIDAARRRRETEWMDKALRSCTAFIARRSARRFAVIDRGDDGPQLRAWLEAPDAPFDASTGHWLKRGNSASVVRVDLDGRARVVKRYNLKSLGHRLRRFWRPSRAWHSWRNAQRLCLWGVPTPRPVALLEHRFGWLRGRAWYVCDWVPGESLAAVLPAADAARRQVLLGRLCELLKTLARLRLSHGDLKATNLLVDRDNQLILLDLDALRRHRRPAAFERAFARDIARLRANWAADAGLATALDRALSDAGLVR